MKKDHFRSQHFALGEDNRDTDVLCMDYTKEIV